MLVSINHKYEVAYGLSIDTDIGDLERRNCPRFAIFRRIR